MNRFFYGAAVTFTALFGLCVVSLAMLCLHWTTEPGLDAIGVAVWWLVAMVVAASGGLLLWPLVILCRRLKRRGSEQPEPPDAVRRRRRARLLRLAGCAAFTVLFGAWYAERASRSGYAVPPLAATSQVTGELMPFSGRERSRAIVIDTGRDRIALGCQPNDRYPGECLTRAEHARLASSRVTARFFTYPDAMRSENILVQLTAAEGRELVSYADQRKALTEQRVRDQRQTRWATVPLSLWIAYVIWLIFELAAAAQAAGERRKTAQAASRA